MDGLLIDSEPFWQDVELEVFGGLGVPITRERCLETVGFRVDEVVAHWHRQHPWEEPAADEVARSLVDGVTAAVAAEGRPKPGVDHALDFLAGKGLRLALASSSLRSVIAGVLATLGLEDRF